VVEAFQKHQAGEMSDEDFAAMLGISLAKESIDDAVPTNRFKRLARYLTKTYLGY
jgi:ribonuclease P protein component